MNEQWIQWSWADTYRSNFHHTKVENGIRWPFVNFARQCQRLKCGRKLENLMQAQNGFWNVPEWVKYGERDGKGVMRICNCLQNMRFQKQRLPKVLFGSAGWICTSGIQVPIWYVLTEKIRIVLKGSEASLQGFQGLGGQTSQTVTNQVLLCWNMSKTCLKHVWESETCWDFQVVVTDCWISWRVGTFLWHSEASSQFGPELLQALGEQRAQTASGWLQMNPDFIRMGQMRRLRLVEIGGECWDLRKVKETRGTP